MHPDFLQSSPSGFLNASTCAGYVRGSLEYSAEPTETEIEKTFLDLGFVAAKVGDARLTGIPFRCRDYYGQTALVFSPLGPESPVRDAIAAAFWDLLLSSPDDLADFAARIYHPGAGIWMNLGCQSGALEYSEEDA